MPRRIFFRALASLVFLTLGASASCSQPPVESIRFRNPDGSQSPYLAFEVAATVTQRNVGLMYRKEIPEEWGMLFLFADEKPRAFWMKNTYVPLDIIFLDSTWRVVSVQADAKPLSPVSLPSSAPAKYVLEVRAGKAKLWGIAKGSIAEVRGDLPTAEPMHGWTASSQNSSESHNNSVQLATDKTH